MKCPALVIISTIPKQQSCAVGIVEADYAQDQLHSTRAPGDSVRSTNYKTKRVVLRGWGGGQSTYKPFCLHIACRQEFSYP